MMNSTYAPLKLVVPNQMGYLPIVLKTVEELCYQQGFDESTIRSVVLACEEAIANVILHAFSPDEEAEFTIQIEPSTTGIAFHVLDKGMPYDSGSETFDEETLRGLGHLMMGRLMDRVQFHNHGNRGKELVLHKYTQETREGEAVKAMDAMWRTLEPYVRHSRGCSYDPTSNDPASEYCTCDLAGAKARLRDMREKLAAAARPAPETREPDFVIESERLRTGDLSRRVGNCAVWLYPPGSGGYQQWLHDSEGGRQRFVPLYLGAPAPAEARQVLALDAIRDVLGIDYDEDDAVWLVSMEPEPPIECATLDDALRAYAKMAAPAEATEPHRELLNAALAVCDKWRVFEDEGLPEGEMGAAIDRLYDAMGAAEGGGS